MQTNISSISKPTLYFNHLTEREFLMHDVAVQIMDSNPDVVMGVTGTLFIRLLDIPIGREAADLDILVRQPLNIFHERNNLPKEITIVGDESKCYEDTKTLEAKYLDEYGREFTIHFIHSENEDFTCFDESPLLFGSLGCLLLSKYHFSKFDKSPDSRKKHKDDFDTIDYWVSERSAQNDYCWITKQLVVSFLRTGELFIVD